MAVERQANVLGQQRWDVPHMRALESSVAADLDLLAGKMIAGKMALVLKGLNLITTGAIGAPATNLKVRTGGALLMHYGASESGTIFGVADDGADEQLSATNSKVTGSFTASQTNFIGLDLLRSADDTTSDNVQFLEPTSDAEISKTVPLARTLGLRFIISTADFSSQPTVLALAKVVTDASNNVSTITDARQMMFRLAEGGDNPNTFAAYTWPGTRYENSTGDVFAGGDKSITDLKTWMDATMTRLWELGGGERWFSATADRGVNLVWQGTAFSNGENYEISGAHLHWKGIRFMFDNSSGYVNDLNDQTGNSAGLTDILNGECIYVDLDRTKFHVIAWAITTAYVVGDLVYNDTDKAYECIVAGTSAGSGGPTGTGLNIVDGAGTLRWKYVGPGHLKLSAVKAPLITLGSSLVPGQRWVIAWKTGGNVYTRGWRYPIGTLFTPATTTAQGVVKITRDYTGLDTVGLSGLNDPKAISDRGGTIAAPGPGNMFGLQSTGFANGQGLIGVSGGTTGFQNIGVHGYTTGGVLGYGVFGAGSDIAGSAVSSSGVGGQGGGATSGNNNGGRGGNFAGGAGFGTGLGGPGVVGQGGANTGTGVVGLGVGTSLPTSTGAGVYGKGSVTEGTVGVEGLGVAATGGVGRAGVKGTGSFGLAAGATLTGGAGGQFQGGDNLSTGLGGHGVEGTGGVANVAGIGDGGYGGKFLGGAGSSSGSTRIGGYGAMGTGGIGALGDGSHGDGLYGVGATAGNAGGVRGLATGTGAGVVGLGAGATSNNFGLNAGVHGVGPTSGPGVSGIGGGTNGVGGNFVGGATNGRGAVGTAAGTGAGVVGFSSGGTGAAVLTNIGGGFYGTNIGVHATGVGASGQGALISAGAGGNAKGMEVSGTGTGVAIDAFNNGGAVNQTCIASAGYVAVNSSDPAAATGFTDMVTAKNITKMWADLTVPAADGAVTVNDGFNITSASVGSNAVTITIADNMSSANYAVSIVPDLTGSVGIDDIYWRVTSKAAGTITLKARYFDGAVMADMPIGSTGGSVAVRINVIVVGAQ